MPPRVSLVAPTYNWPEALELLLLSLKRQTLLPVEFVIADDGSTDATKVLIKRFQKNFPIPIRHVWQEDLGYRKIPIMNKAIAQAKGDYIIQTDGDCILHKKFIEDHVNAIAQNTYLFGSRVSLKQYCVPLVFQNKQIQFSFFSLFLKKRMRSLHLPFFKLFFKPNLPLSKKLRGCNLSFWKKDFIAVNGYNEDLIGWGRDDTELMYRFVHNHIYGKRLKFKAILFHIWHREASKTGTNRNTEITYKTINEKLKRCNNGIDKYLTTV